VIGSLEIVILSEPVPMSIPAAVILLGLFCASRISISPFPFDDILVPARSTVVPDRYKSLNLKVDVPKS
jgi:hypothetical protein